MRPNAFPRCLSKGGRALVCLVLAATLPVEAQYQWTCRYPNLGYAPYDGRAWEGNHSVKYVSYIPFDHILGPTECWNVPAGWVDTKYKGDPNAIIYGYPPQSWRSSSFFPFRIADGSSGPLLKDRHPTKGYGFGSPINGSTLSGLDEDGVAHDCFVWHNTGWTDNSTWRHEFSVPYSTQGQVRFWGEASNPLEASQAKIAWDMRTVVDISNLDHVTARVNYNHTCFPAHSVSVNNFVVYNYIPPRNDRLYVANCLLFQQDKIIGQQTSSTRVPCN